MSTSPDTYVVGAFIPGLGCPDWTRTMTTSLAYAVARFKHLESSPWVAQRKGVVRLYCNGMVRYSTGAHGRPQNIPDVQPPAESLL